MRDELAQIAAEDDYSLDSMTFKVGGNTVIVHDMLLGQAIASLPPQRREVILLSYFLDKKDPQIAALLHLGVDAVFFRRNSALERLRKILEGLNYGR